MTLKPRWPKRPKWSNRTIEGAILYCDIEASVPEVTLTREQIDGYFACFTPKMQALALYACWAAPWEEDWRDPNTMRYLWAEAAQQLREGWLPDE